MDSMTETVGLVDRLTEHRTLGVAPREELEWLAAHATMERYETGEALRQIGESVDALYVVLAGSIAVYIDRGAGRHKLLERRTGDVTGLLPYSRLANPVVETVTQEPTTVLVVGRDCFREMIRECHELTSILVHVMLDRARQYNSSELHDEKMVSLGRLAAGLAHELNNPAAAIERSALQLRQRLKDTKQAARVLCAANLTEEQLAALDRANEACSATPVHGVRSPLEEAEREEAISDWLADHGLDTALAGPLGETATTMADGIRNPWARRRSLWSRSIGSLRVSREVLSSLPFGGPRPAGLWKILPKRSRTRRCASRAW